MPFKSERQRRWMHANKPEMAMRWEHEEKKLSSIARKRLLKKGKKRAVSRRYKR